jgi:hypothetical protein
MKIITLLFFTINFYSFAQLKLSGEWQGILVENNQNWKDGKPIYLTISVINGLIDGKIREEIYNSNSFSVIKISGKTTSPNSIELLEDRILKQSEKISNPCLRQLKLVYNEESGYFEGFFESKKCPISTGKIILYKSKFEFNDKKELGITLKITKNSPVYATEMKRIQAKQSKNNNKPIDDKKNIQNSGIDPVVSKFNMVKN